MSEPGCEEFLRRFESAEMTSEEFGHVEHVRMAWLYLRAHPLPVALARICEGIRHFAEVHGAGGLYHETITVGYALLICSRLGDEGESWDEFQARNPELFEPKLGLLRRYYAEETLHSAVAKQRFVWPERTRVISRQEARRRIATFELHRLDDSKRRSLIEVWWSIDPSDSEWAALPRDLQEEIESSSQPRFDLAEERYDPLLMLALVDESFGVRSDWLAAELKRLGEDANITVEEAPEPMMSCRCCGYHTIRSRGDYEICPVCMWEDDGLDDADQWSSPNHQTLRDGRENVARFGACSENMLAHVRPETKQMYEGPAQARLGDHG